MNEPSQESNCIVIDAPSPLYSLSVKDEELIETFSKRNFNDYKRLWSDIASNKLTGNNGEKLSSDTIYNSSDDLLVPYIIDLLRNNKELSQKYDLHPDEPNIYRRLFLAHNDYEKELLQNFKIYMDSFQNQLAESAKEIQTAAMQSISLLSSALSNIANFSNLYTFNPFNITSPEKIEQYIDAYKQWGYYGWTAFPFMSDQDFQTFPESKEFADQAMIPLCTKENLFDLVEEIKDYKILSNNDLDEALFCFKKKHYKPCAYMLLSFIERLLIITAKQINPTSHAYSGRATKIIYDDIDDKSYDHFEFDLLYCFNTLSCLSTLFESSNNFENEPNHINRHFMMHGMSNRKVTYHDCIKLFLLVYNLVFLSDYLFSSEKEV